MSSSYFALAGERIAFCRHAQAAGTIVFAAALALYGAVVAANESLTLDAAQRLAVERSRHLSAQESAIVAAREMSVAAEQLPDPVLKFGIDSWPINGPHQFSISGDDFTMGRVGLSQELTGRKKRMLRAQRFEREGETTLAEKAATVAAIERDTAIAWIGRYYSETMAAVLASQVEQANFAITAADGAYRAGRGEQADVLAARAARAEIEDRVIDVDRQVLTTKTALARWVGEAAFLPLADKPDMDFVKVDHETLEAQVDHHPEIAVLAKREALAWADVKLTEASKHADWSVELAYAQRGSGRSDFVSLSLSIPLQWDHKNRQDREVAAKMAMAEQAGAEREEAIRNDVGAVLTQLQEWESSKKRLANYRNVLIPLGQKRTQATLAAYKSGTAPLTDVLLSRRDEIDAQLRALQLEMDTARLWAQLNFLVPDFELATSGDTPHERAHDTGATQ